MMQENSIPEEVVEEILSRLPVKPLGRFKSVCKSWCNLISSETFVNIHLNNYTSTSDTFLGFKEEQVSSPSKNNYFSLHLISPEEAVVDKDLNIPPQVLEVGGSYPHVCGPCNGIIYVYNYPFNRGILYNPATKDFKLIPESNYVLGEDLTCEVEVGFDTNTNDYKILQIVNPMLCSTHLGTEFGLYSLRSNCWRKLIDTPIAIMPGSVHQDICSLNFTRHRIISWLVTNTGDQWGWQLCMFDVSSETFEIFNLDGQAFRLPQGGDYAMQRGFQLFPSRESVALVLYTAHDSCDIWVMNDFSFSAKSRSWTRLWSIACHNNCRVLGFWGNHQLVLQNWHGKLKLFDLRSREWVDLAFYTGLIVAYKESLLALAKFSGCPSWDNMFTRLYGS